MHIGIVTYRIVKGDAAGRVFREIVRAAAERGHDLTLVAERFDDDLVALPLVRTIRIATERFPTQLARTLSFAANSARRIKALIRRPDVWQANGFVTSAPADVVAAHFVLRAWLDTETARANRFRSVRYAYQDGLARLVSSAEIRAFENARVVVAVSDRIASELAALGIARERIRVIPNAVDSEQFQPRTVDRVRLGLPAGVPLVLFGGDIGTPRKNLDVVLQALVMRPELHLAVAGGGQRGGYYRRKIDALGLTSRVHLLGLRADDFPSVMNAADLFVLPSHYEPFGMVVLEAMASGLPTIVSRLVGAADLVRVGGGIVLEDENDAACLAAAFDRIVHHPDRGRRMAAAARSAALEHPWSLAANRYVDLYEELAAADRAACS